MRYRGESFCHDFGQVFTSGNVVQGKRLADEVFSGEVIGDVDVFSGVVDGIFRNVDA